MLTLPEHLSLLPIFSGVRVTLSLVLCACFVDRYLSFCAFFLFAIVLSVLRRFTDSHYPFGIFKLFFLNIYIYQEGNMANLCELCIAGDQITFAKHHIIINSSLLSFNI